MSMFKYLFGFPSRFRCPQYDLQCVSCAVTQLQQPVRRWLRHRVQTKTHDSLHLLLLGSFVLEKVSDCCLWDKFIKLLGLLFFFLHMIKHFCFHFRQKVCCGIVYKGRFGEVIIDPRLFKPCCSSKKQKTLASTQVAAHLPDTLPPQLPEDVKESWWLLLLNPPVGLSKASPPGFVSSGRPPQFHSNYIC